jgi:hypothetical protein
LPFFQKLASKDMAKKHQNIVISFYHNIVCENVVCDEGLTWNCFAVWQISFRSVKDIVLLGTLSKDDPVLGLGFPLQEGIEESLVIFQTSEIDGIEESKLLIMNTVKMQKVLFI